MGTSIMIANWLTIVNSRAALRLSLRFFSSERSIRHIILFLVNRVYTFFHRHKYGHFYLETASE